MHRARQKSDRMGAVALEVAIVLIPFLLLVLGLLDFGRLILTQHMVATAARQGGRQACVNTDVNGTANNKSSAEIESEMEANLAGLLQDADVQIYYFDDSAQDWTLNATFQQRIAVEVQGVYVPFTPLFSLLGMGTNHSVPLSTRTIVRSEGH